jgi:hypothetical protein
MIPGKSFAVMVNLASGRTRSSAIHAGADFQDYQATGMLRRVELPGPAKIPV